METLGDMKLYSFEEVKDEFMGKALRAGWHFW